MYVKKTHRAFSCAFNYQIINNPYSYNVSPRTSSYSPKAITQQIIYHYPNEPILHLLSHVNRKINAAPFPKVHLFMVRMIKAKLRKALL